MTPERHGGPPYSSAPCTSAADNMLPSYEAASGGAHTHANAAEPLYSYPTPQNDGQSYPTYSDFFDFDGASNGAATQPASGFPVLCQAGNGYPYGWDYSLVDAGRQFSNPPLVNQNEGNRLQPQASWDQTGRTNPAMTNGTMTMASPMSQYVPMGTLPPNISSYESLDWPPPPVGQTPLSPSQSSPHSCSSPSSGAYSRKNSYSSISALTANAVDSAQIYAHFRPMPEQGPSPASPQLPGKANAQRSNNSKKPSSSVATQKTESRKKSGPKPTAHHSQLVPPSAATSSPKNTNNSTIVIPDSPTPTSNGPGGPAGQPKKQQQQQQQQQKVLTPPPGQQGQQQQQQQQTAVRTQRSRNRAAATKCRAKTKLAVADLESTEQAVSSEHRRLSATARGLRDEVLLLKNELLSHGNCDDGLIQQYLANQARMVSGGGGGGGQGQGTSRQHYHHQHQHGHRRAGAHSVSPSSS